MHSFAMGSQQYLKKTLTPPPTANSPVNGLNETRQNIQILNS
jgi:hypothetical protein